jgi:hypothetical protein
MFNQTYYLTKMMEGVLNFWWSDWRLEWVVEWQQAKSPQYFFIFSGSSLNNCSHDTDT